MLVVHPVIPVSLETNAGAGMKSMYQRQKTKGKFLPLHAWAWCTCYYMCILLVPDITKAEAVVERDRKGIANTEN